MRANELTLFVYIELNKCFQSEYLYFIKIIKISNKVIDKNILKNV